MEESETQAFWMINALVRPTKKNYGDRYCGFLGQSMLLLQLPSLQPYYSPYSMLLLKNVPFGSGSSQCCWDCPVVTWTAGFLRNNYRRLFGGSWSWTSWPFWRSIRRRKSGHSFDNDVCDWWWWTELCTKCNCWPPSHRPISDHSVWPTLPVWIGFPGLIRAGLLANHLIFFGVRWWWT